MRGALGSLKQLSVGWSLGWLAFASSCVAVPAYFQVTHEPERVPYYACSGQLGSESYRLTTEACGLDPTR